MKGGILPLLTFILIFSFPPRELANALRNEEELNHIFLKISDKRKMFLKALSARCNGECCKEVYSFAFENEEIDPLLLWVLVYVESSFNRFALSNHGAIGITQLKPEVAKSISYEMGIPFSEELLFDCKYNLKVGIYFFKKMLETFGNLELALVAYNYGPTFVLRKLQSGEFIPRRYISKVEEAIEELKKYEE